MHNDERSPLVTDLLAEEPYALLASRYGAGALPEIRALIADDSEPGLAAKAAYLAGLLGAAAVPVLVEASRSPIEVVRIAVASVLDLGGAAAAREAVGRTLLADESETVRLSAIRSLGLAE